MQCLITTHFAKLLALISKGNLNEQSVYPAIPSCLGPLTKTEKDSTPQLHDQRRYPYILSHPQQIVRYLPFLDAPICKDGYIILIAGEHRMVLDVSGLVVKEGRKLP
jgi:hypothetical protein